MKTETSRRALLGCAGLASMALIAPAAAAVQTFSVSARDAEWDALIAAYDRASAKLNAVSEEHDAASAEYMASRTRLGDKPTKPKAPQLDGKTLDAMTLREIREMDTTVPAEEQARYDVALAAWTAEQEALDEQIMGDVDERWQAAVDEQDAAAHAIFAQPAPDAAALTRKLALAEEAYRGCDLDAKVMHHIFNDVRRLANVEA